MLQSINKETTAQLKQKYLALDIPFIVSVKKHIIVPLMLFAQYLNQTFTRHRKFQRYSCILKTSYFFMQTSVTFIGH